MSGAPNDYNGFVKNTGNNNNGNLMMLNPTAEIENLLQKKNQYDNRVKEIKKFLNM